MRRYAKFIILFIALLFLILLFIAYKLNLRDNRQNNNFSNDVKAEKIALITTINGVDDGSFCQSAWAGVREFGEKNKVNYQYYKPLSDAVAEIINAVELAVADGATVVVMPAFQLIYALDSVHKEYPTVKFIGIDMSPIETMGKLGANAFLYTFREEEAGYLAGYATVIEGYTRLGYLGGMEVGPVVRYGYGFLLGADAAARKLNKHISVNYHYAGQFFGDANISAKMDGWYTNGTEIVFACGGTLYTSVLESAIHHKGMMIGVDTDQHSLGMNKANYDPILTSAMKNITATVENLLSIATSGRWNEIGGKHRVIGIKDGDYIGLPTAEESWQFKHFTRDEYDKLLDKMRNGEITVKCNINHKPHLTNTKVHGLK